MAADIGNISHPIHPDNSSLRRRHSRVGFDASDSRKRKFGMAISCTVIHPLRLRIELKINGDIEKQVHSIKNEKGKDIWLFGGASLTASLMNLGLIDELWLSVHPILLGVGKPLFSGIEKRVPLQLTDSKTYDSGLVSLKYIFQS